MSDEDQEWMHRLETMFPPIEQWAARTRSEQVTVPAPGSSLAHDDQVYPAAPLSHLAYGALATAAEHLELFRVAFLGTQTLYPTAYFTLLRTALMCGAQAVWMLKPPTHEQRAENALRRVRDDIKQSSGLLSDDVPAALGFAEGIAAAKQALQQEVRDVQAAVATLGLDPAGVPGWRLSMTNVIKSVASMVHGEGGEDPTRYGTTLLWRLQSAHAHGTPSARTRQIGPDQVLHHPDGTTLGRAVTTLTDVGTAASAAVLFVNEGWRLYDLGCQPPEN